MSVARRNCAGIALGLGALVVSGCRPEPPPPRNVVVVLVDALRADRMSLYGYARKTTPEIDRLARESGITFRNAWANAGCTWASTSSMLTGRWPQRIVAHHARVGMRIPAEIPTLAERLAAAGWTTAAVSTSFAQPKASPESNREMFARGFATYDNRCIGGPAKCVNEVAFETLRGLAEPFFLYLHYFDPHAAYRPPDDAALHFTAPADASLERWIARGDANPILAGLYHGAERRPPPEAVVRRFSDLYDEEVRYFDGRFRELFDHLRERGLLANTAVVLIADHGEEMFENGEWGHCRSLAFDTVLRTPIVFFVPGLAPGERATPASNVDLAPTLIDLLRLPLPPDGLDGDSLRGVLAEGDDPASLQRVAFSAEGVIRLAASAERAVRFDLRRKRWLAPDGRELEAGSPLDREERRLRRALLEWIGAVEARGGGRRAVRDAEALERELRAIGYL